MMAIAWPAPRTLIAAGLGVLVLVVVLGGAWFWYSAQQDRAQIVHADALAHAATARGGQTPGAVAAAIPILETALAQAPGAGLAAHTAYELGHLRFETGQFPAARAAYEIAIAKTASPTMRTLARAGIGSTWEAQGDFAKAIDAYSAALAGESPEQFYYEDLLVSLARTQELAGQRDAAIATYKRLLKEVPKLRRETEVRARLASLGAQS